MKLHYCRICLKNVGRVSLETMLSVSLGTKSCAKWLSYNEVINYCLDLQVLSKSDKFTRVCKPCSKKLVSFYQFKYKARKNDHCLQLMKLVDEENPIKVEDPCQEESTDRDHIQTETYYDEEHVNDEETHKNYDNHEQIPVKIEKNDEFGDFTDDGIKTEDLLLDEDFVTEENSLIEEDKQINQPKELPKKQKRKPIKPKEYHEHVQDPPESVTSDSGPDMADSDEEFNLKTYMEEMKGYKLPSTHKEKRRKKICDICGKLVERLTRHACGPKQIEPVELDYDCELCGVNVKGTKKYYRFFDGVRKDLCHACFINNPKKHLNFICPTCGLGRPSKSALTSHMACHTTERPFQCPNCQLAFKSLYTMKLHVSTVHEKAAKRFSCTDCFKSFYKNSALRRHKLIHSGKREYKCQLCPKAYNTPQGLRQHLQVHAGEKKEVCPVCGKGFIFKSTLAAHIKIHSEQPRVQCRYCSQTFTRSYNRDSHEKLKHPNQEVTESRKRKPRKTRAIKVKNVSLRPKSPKSPISSVDSH